LDGWTITEADINIRSEYGRSLANAKIESHNPWRMEQIQSIYYYCRESLGELEDFIEYFPPEEFDLISTNRILDIVLDKLKNAKDQLLPCSISIENCINNKKYFKKNIPNDVLVDIQVKNQVFVITSTLVSIGNSLLKTSSRSSSSSPRESRKLTRASTTALSKSKKSNSKHISSPRDRDRRPSGQYEIIEQFAVECKSKKLHTLCTLLQNSYSLVLDCKEKNMVLQSIEFVL